jgi:Na+/melibiose symporter-like transporter
MAVIWSFGSFAFFLIPFYLNRMQANIYHLSLATEGAEFFASIACLFIERVMPLKRALFLCLLLIVIGSVGISLTGSMDGEPLTKDNQLVGLILITNIGTVAAFDIAYLINAKLFPTHLLATAYGICNIFGRFVSIASPVTARAPEPIPMLTLTAFASICGGLSIFLR